MRRCHARHTIVPPFVANREIGMPPLSLIPALIFLVGADATDPYSPNAMARQGFERTHRAYRGVLRERQTDRLTVRLEAGRRYRLVLRCDEDCAGAALGIAVDGRPVVTLGSRAEPAASSFVPGTGGLHEVLVAIGRCDRQPCAYSIELWSTPSLGSRLKES